MALLRVSLILCSLVLTHVIAQNGTTAYYGGYALGYSDGKSCPHGTNTCEASTGCCPTGTVCDSRVNYLCCPDGEDCLLQVEQLKTCADPSWVLWEGLNSYCCQKGETGSLNEILCNKKGIAVPPESQATTFQQANTIPPPSGTAVASASTTDTAGATVTATTPKILATKTKATKTASAGSTSSNAAAADMRGDRLQKGLAAAVVVGLMAV